MEACNRAITLKPNDVTFPYVNGILESWYKNNVHSFADIAALDEKHTSKRKAVAVGGTADPSGSGNIDKLQQLEDFYLNGGKKG